MEKLAINQLFAGYQNGEEHIEVLRGVNMTLNDGDFAVLLGASGCGKTTLLKIIAGLLPYHAGDIFLDGQDVDRLPVQKRNVAYVAQNTVLYPHLTIFDNLALPLKQQRKPATEIYAAVERISQVIEMGDFLSRKPSQLSVGQQQRIALGKNLIKDASIYLFDEPFSSLDLQLRQKLSSYLHNEQKTRNLTVLFVTHNLSDIVTSSDKVFFMDNGIITMR